MAGPARIPGSRAFVHGSRHAVGVVTRIDARSTRVSPGDAPSRSPGRLVLMAWAEIALPERDLEIDEGDLILK